MLFSPNGRRVASASFDKSVKVWDGKSGKFVSTLRGHVRAVYQISWSADGKLLVSGSSDSTVKVGDCVGLGRVFCSYCNVVITSSCATQMWV